MATFPKKTESNSTSGATYSPYKKSGTFGAKDDLKDVECYKCHKKGHYANKCPEIKAKDTKGPLKARKMEQGITQDDAEKKSIRQIRVRFSDLESETKDPFMRFWVILSNLGQERIGVQNEGHPARVFVDTGANCNTISRKFYKTLVSQGLECVFHAGPPKGFTINLVGKQVLQVTGD